MTLRHFFLLCHFLLIVLSAHATEPKYPREVAQWQEISVPPASNQSARMVWSYAANYSDYEWRVFAENGQIYAQLATAKPQAQREHPRFTIPQNGFGRPSSLVRVDDGWLVGFNKGEWGGALWWFSPDGERSYQISSHQIVDFFSLPDGVHAIEGMYHLGISKGSVIRIARAQPNARWQAITVIELPFAPFAVSVRHDGTMLMTLANALVQMDRDREIVTLLADPPWVGIYPNSSALSSDEQKLYIGMRQFVGEFDISTKKLRLLIPSARFLNKLPKKDEQEIRKQYGG
jgi:hypothetical protein